jgi:hypothetical protein
MPLEIPSMTRSGPVEIRAYGRAVARVRFLRRRNAWLAEVGERCRFCPSFGSALNAVSAALDG